MPRIRSLGKVMNDEEANLFRAMRHDFWATEYNRERRREILQMYYLAIFLFVVIMGAAYLMGCTKPAPDKLSAGCAVIHSPASGCPANWTLDPQEFVEKDSTTEDACHAPDSLGLPGCVDQLKPGEAIQITVHIHPAQHVRYD